MASSSSSFSSLSLSSQISDCAKVIHGKANTLSSCIDNIVTILQISDLENKPIFSKQDPSLATQKKQLIQKIIALAELIKEINELIQQQINLHESKNTITLFDETFLTIARTITQLSNEQSQNSNDAQQTYPSFALVQRATKSVLDHLSIFFTQLQK